MSGGPFFRMEKINKIYQMGQQQAHVLFDVDLSIEEGEYLSVLGYYSGSLHGEYDEATRAAVRLFNEDYGFPGLDDLSLGSARALMEAYYYNRGDLGKL